MLTMKKRILLAFTIFAMFFGAGNLIFPPYLAYQAGRSILPAFIGFIMTAIGLPVLSLIAIGRAGSLKSLASRVHPAFGTAFTIAIYLAIGPCLAIPRTASTSYEMVAKALGTGRTIGVIYSIIFFAISGLMALRPEKLTKRLGRLLSPLLILLIIILLIGSVTLFDGRLTEAAGPYADVPFTTGFQEGYQTMDALAGLVFGIILSVNLKALGAEGRVARKESVLAAAGGGLLLLIVYTAIAFIGIVAEGLSEGATNGAAVLSDTAAAISGRYGRIMLALIFVIACFNTSVSLLSSCGEYFSRLVPRIGRGIWIAIFATASCIISNAGLDMIISISSPVLTVLYPAAIVLIALALVPGMETRRWTHMLSVAAALVSSLVMGSGFTWLIPTAAALIIGIVLDKKCPIPMAG